MRTLALSVGLSWVAAGCSAVPVEQEGFLPFDTLPEEQRTEVRSILSDAAAVVELETQEVKSRLDVYEFLLSEMPFTGGVVRELGRGVWEIYRHPKEPRPEVFYISDPDGIWLRFELIHRAERRRVYISRGFFEMGLLPRLEGRTVIDMRMEPREGTVVTGATVYVKVETPFYAGAAKSFRGLLERKVREKSGAFIRAAKWVAEEAARRPDWLYTQVRGSKEVDADVLEAFRRQYLAP